uniref:Uncharacterized protein n=1 Tax=Anguilla anguilla TaxID=7936 RepID=A0A0E9QFZ9_ANGAN
MNDRYMTPFWLKSTQPLISQFCDFSTLLGSR